MKLIAEMTKVAAPRKNTTKSGKGTAKTKSGKGTTKRTKTKSNAKEILLNFLYNEIQPLEDKFYDEIMENSEIVSNYNYFTSEMEAAFHTFTEVRGELKRSRF